MNYKITVIALATLITATFSHAIVKIYMHEGPYQQNIVTALNKQNIPFEKVQSLDTNDQTNLYIIDNILDQTIFPPYYIAYQTNNLKRTISENLLTKLSNAVAVWDISWTNIDTYKKQVTNYYFFPLNYDFEDPVVLPCLLPIDALQTYKGILSYSNARNTDISSHLPSLFVHTLLQNPKTILELGVRSGESTVSLAKVAEYMDAQLIGIDIDPKSAYVYAKLTSIKAQFIHMNDIDFASSFSRNHPNQKIDAIFIDTSHLYQHTMQELQTFVPLLSNIGVLIFHDSNVTPLNNNSYYARINNTTGYGGHGNTRGVTQAIKEYFGLDFDEYSYYMTTLSKNNLLWKITHYPFCNGLTVIQKVGESDHGDL